MKNILLIGVLLLLVYSCTKNNDENNTNVIKTKTEYEPKIVKLVGTWLNQGDREKILTEFVRHYNFTHQETKIEITFSEQINDYVVDNNAFLEKQMMSAESDYDILLLNNCYSTVFGGEPDWARKYMVDFSKFDEFKYNTIDGLINDSILNLWHGIIPGPFVEGFSYTLWCNTNVAQKVGIDVTQIGMSFDDFLSYIKAVNDYNKSNPDNYIIPIMEGGADWKTLSYVFEQLYASIINDKNEYFANYISEKKLNAWHTTLQELERLSAYNPLSPNWKTMGWVESVPNLLADKCLFYVNGSWLYNQSDDTENIDNIKNLMPTEFPVVNPVSTYPSGFQIPWGVPKNAPNKEAAIEFLLKLNSSLFAEDWVRKTKSPTGIKGSVADVTLGQDHFENYIYGINEKYGSSNFEANGNQTLFGDSLKYNANYAHEVLAKELTADEALAKIRDDLANSGVEIVQN